MTEVNLEQAFEQLQETSKSQQQEIESLKTKLLYLTETEMVKTRAELKLNQKNLDNLTNAHGFTEKMVQNLGNETKQIQEQVTTTLTQELTAATALIQQTQQEAENLFVGAVMAFAMPMAPEGWLECNGQAVSRTEYARLFERIEVTFGVGDGENTFNLPDLSGLFIRGWCEENLLDPDREFGSKQNDQIQDHHHNALPSVVANGSDEGRVRKGSDITEGKKRFIKNVETNHLHVSSPTNASEANYVRYGKETRPRNVALLYCIKY
jgi:phage-related tail fiber protein